MELALGRESSLGREKILYTKRAKGAIISRLLEYVKRRSSRASFFTHLEGVMNSVDLT
jgi:hypothetical protein